jgi:hypothetical protein
VDEIGSKRRGVLTLGLEAPWLRHAHASRACLTLAGRLEVGFCSAQQKNPGPDQRLPRCNPVITPLPSLVLNGIWVHRGALWGLCLMTELTSKLSLNFKRSWGMSKWKALHVLWAVPFSL